MTAHFRLGGAIPLDAQNADHQLQAVLHPVIDFPKQYFMARKSRLQIALEALSLDRHAENVGGALEECQVIFRELTFRAAVNLQYAEGGAVALPMMPGSHPTPARTNRRLAAGRYSRTLQNSASIPSAVRIAVWSTNLSNDAPCRAKTPSSASISCWRTRNLSERSVISSLFGGTGVSSTIGSSVIAS